MSRTQAKIIVTVWVFGILIGFYKPIIMNLIFSFLAGMLAGNGIGKLIFEKYDR